MRSPADLTALRVALPRWKRALDLACGLAVLPVFAFTTFFAVLLIKFTSPGPVLFRQERVGLNGRRFRLYKFRTMHVSASANTHQAHLVQLMKSNAPLQKLDTRGDARMISGAWWLRASGLDELPQIINVLRGEMSVVGPRPCLPYEYEHYTPQQRERVRSVPGLTGLWQVSGKNRTTFEQMVELDLAYAQRRSLKTDLLIMVKTVPTLCAQILDTQVARRVVTRGQAGTGEAAIARPKRGRRGFPQRVGVAGAERQ